jgi:DNA-directed RNA polymerase subunit RPC12/RpoP
MNEAAEKKVRPFCADSIKFMTKQEFVSQIRTRDHQYVIRGWIGLALIVIALGAVGLVQHLETHERSSKILYGLIAGFLLVGTVALICWGEGRGVRCPSCGTRLFGTRAQIAIATGNCGYCGQKVFEQPFNQNKPLQ